MTLRVNGSLYFFYFLNKYSCKKKENVEEFDCIKKYVKTKDDYSTVF